MLPNDLQIAMKEWNVVCSALGEGRQIILLRKGGIYESGGEFEIERPQFFLFPTYLHQNAEMLKPSEHANLKPIQAEPEKIDITFAAEITDILPMTSRATMDALSYHHIWTSKLIDMRFNYRPENPLYLLLVRAYRLNQPFKIGNTPAYAGCKSWVPLEHSHPTAATPVLNDAKFAQRRAAILSHT